MIRNDDAGMVGLPRHARNSPIANPFDAIRERLATVDMAIRSLNVQVHIFLDSSSMWGQYGYVIATEEIIVCSLVWNLCNQNICAIQQLNLHMCQYILVPTLSDLQVIFSKNKITSHMYPWLSQWSFHIMGHPQG